MKKILMLLSVVLLYFISVKSIHAMCYKHENNVSGEIIYSSKESEYGYKNLGAISTNSTCTQTDIDNDKKNNYGASLKNHVTCGNMGKFNKKIPEITSWIVTVAEILVPVILVIFGAIDFVKGIISQKEDEIKKGQSIFVKRLITGVIVFFIVAFTKLIVSGVSGNGEKAGLIDCIDCFISNKCS